MSSLWHKVNLKKSLSRFSPSFTGCHNKVKELCVPFYLPLTEVLNGLSKPMAVSRPKGPQLRLGHLRVGKLQHWQLCLPCVALDLAVHFKLWSGPHCTKWFDDQHSTAGFEPRLVPDLPLPLIPAIIDLRVIDLVSGPVWWGTVKNIYH